MKKQLFVFTIVAAFSAYAMAAEKKPLKEVEVDAFAADTQVMPQGSGDNHIALALWLPVEYWGSIMARDATTSEADKKEMLDTLSEVSLFAVVQADVTAFGTFRFYSKEEIEKNMRLSFVDADGNERNLSPMKKIETDIEILLGVFKPILRAAMGNLGENMHFYVIKDKSETGSRLLDPYEKGNIRMELSKRDQTVMPGTIELPVNALFYPRKCPNGKDAHVSWKYCPWTGEKLAD